MPINKHLEIPFQTLERKAVQWLNAASEWAKCKICSSSVGETQNAGLVDACHGVPSTSKTQRFH